MVNGAQMVSLLLLFIAYTVGIGTVIVTGITMKRGYSTREQFLFILSFLVLIICITMYQTVGSIFGTLSLLSLTAVAAAIPRAIASFRSDVPPGGNRAILLLGTVPVLAAFLMNDPLREYPAYIHLVISITYSMILMNRHRSESSLAIGASILRKGIPLVTLLALPTILLTDVFGIISLSGTGSDSGFYTLPLFYTLLNLLFFHDSLKQLTEKRIFDSSAVIESLPLTEREREVTALLLEGLPYAAIGSRLNIAPSTVKTHCSNIYEKLSIANRYQLFGFIMNSQK